MKKQIFSLFLILMLSVLSSCAPTLMSTEKFPIRTGDTWTLKFAQTPEITRDFRLWGSPTRKEDYVVFGGVSDSDDVAVALTETDTLIVIISLDDQPVETQKNLTCILQQDRGQWTGNGFIGTDTEFKKLTRTQFFKQPFCEIHLKQVRVSQS